MKFSGDLCDGLMLVILQGEALVGRLTLAVLALLLLGFPVLGSLLVNNSRGDFLFPALITAFFLKPLREFLVFMFPFWAGSSWHSTRGFDSQP